MKKRTKINILEGSLVKSIIKLGYPVALGILAQTLYDLADAFWLGKLGKEALTAPTISFSLIMFLLSIGVGFSIAGTSLVSQYTGAKETEKVNLTTGNVLLFLTLLSVILSGIGLISGRYLLSLLQTPSDAFQYTLDYYQIVIGGMPLLFPFFVYQSVMNGIGDTLSPLKITLFTASMNMLFDPMLIFGWFGFPVMGVKGAALATILTRALSSFIGLYLLFSGKKSIHLKPHHLKPDKDILRLMVKIGFPSAIGFSGSSLGFILLIGIVNSLGTVVVSAYGIVSRVIQFFMMPSMGISSAVTAIVGQNLGAGNIQRAKETVIKGMILMSWFSAPIIIFLMIFGKQITIMFIPGVPLIHKMGTVMFYIAPASLIFFGLASVIQGAFQGAGYAVPVMITNIARIWLFRVPLVYYLSIIISKGASAKDASLGIWWGMLFSNIAAFLMIYIWYLRGKWVIPRIRGTTTP